MFDWIANIKCDIKNGKAFLAGGHKTITKCAGNCSECDEFLGVNISQVGEKTLDGSCCMGYNKQHSKKIIVH